MWGLDSKASQAKELLGQITLSERLPVMWQCSQMGHRQRQLGGGTMSSGLLFFPCLPQAHCPGLRSHHPFSRLFSSPQLQSFLNSETFDSPRCPTVTNVRHDPDVPSSCQAHPSSPSLRLRSRPFTWEGDSWFLPTFQTHLLPLAHKDPGVLSLLPVKAMAFL